MGGGDVYKLDELAERAGTSPRTVRYYVQRGLLPAPAFRGKDSAYSQEHLVRLRAIRRLQERFLPLDAIQVELAGKAIEAIERIADEKAPDPLVPQQPRQTPRFVASTGSTGSTRWARVELAPGLELHLADDAPPEAVRMADRIRREMTGGGRR
jgi:DNA-binding transcriptional MerR regulator